MRKTLNPRKPNPIWLVSEQDFRDVINQSYSFKEVSEKLNIRVKDRNYRPFHKRIMMENLSISHFNENFSKISDFQKGRMRPLESVTVENSNYSRYSLKKRLIDGKFFENKCSICGLKDSWNSKPIVMILDHINGINNDNRIINLRLVCPNCNSQLETFSGRNCKRVKIDKKCTNCNSEISNGNASGLCRKCSILQRPLNINRRSKRPSKNELLTYIKNSTWIAVGEKYGVSDNAIRRWAKDYGLPTDKSIRDFVFIPSENGLKVTG